MSDQAIGLISGSAHLLLSIALGVGTAYGSFRIFHRFIVADDHAESLKANNVAMGVVLAGVLVATALIVKSSVSPAVSAIQVFFFNAFAWTGLAKLLGLVVGYVLLAILLANLCIWISMRAFLSLTRHVDELAEIRKNNVAVALALGFTIAIMGLFISDGLSSLLQALIPFPLYAPVEILGG